MGGDGRIPVMLHPRGAEPVPAPGAALVVVGDGAVPNGWGAATVVPETVLAAPHPGGCSCCGGRNGFSRLLGELFRGRATGILPFFDAVVVSLPQGMEGAAAETLDRDPLASSRYRLQTAFKRKLTSD